MVNYALKRGDMVLIKECAWFEKGVSDMLEIRGDMKHLAGTTAVIIGAVPGTGEGAYVSRATKERLMMHRGAKGWFKVLCSDGEIRFIDRRLVDTFQSLSDR